MASVQVKQATLTLMFWYWTIAIYASMISDVYSNKFILPVKHDSKVIWKDMH